MLPGVQPHLPSRGMSKAQNQIRTARQTPTTKPEMKNSRCTSTQSTTFGVLGSSTDRSRPTGRWCTSVQEPTQYSTASAPPLPLSFPILCAMVPHPPGVGGWGGWGGGGASEYMKIGMCEKCRRNIRIDETQCTTAIHGRENTSQDRHLVCPSKTTRECGGALGFHGKEFNKMSQEADMGGRQ